MKAVYAAGTPATLSETPGLLTFGTTSPTVSITKNTRHLITARVLLSLAGCTLAEVVTVTFKLRVTSGTAGDIAHSTTSIQVGAIASSGQNEVAIPLELPPVLHSPAAVPETIQLWGSVSGLPDTGDLKISEACIIVE
jgi:hypothetical protein